MPGGDLMIGDWHWQLSMITGSRVAWPGFLPKFNAKSAVTFQTRGEIVHEELWNITAMFQMWLNSVPQSQGGLVGHALMKYKQYCYTTFNDVKGGVFNNTQSKGICLIRACTKTADAQLRFQGLNWAKTTGAGFNNVICVPSSTKYKFDYIRPNAVYSW